MGGDLNQKKSFHPTLIKNQARVYDEERKALEERKRTQQRIEEIKQERKQEELQRQLEAAGGRKKVDRVDWMYQGPTDGGHGNGAPEELEAFLLGKRRIVIKDTETKKLEKQAGEEAFLSASSNANNTRDLAAKMREDPLFAIKRQEQARYEAIMNDPIQRRMLLAKSGMPDSDKSTKKEKRQRRSERREHSDDERRHRRRRSRSRSRSPRRRKRDDEEDRYRARSHRYSRSRSASSGEKRYDSDVDSDRKRSRSWERRRRDTDGGDARNSEYKHRDLDRKTREGDGKHNYGSEDRDRRERGFRERHQDGRGNSRQHDHSSSRLNDQVSRNNEDERSRKLAAMQSAASELDQDRDRRLAALEQREQAARDSDDRARASDIGGGRQFANSLHRKAIESNGLGDRIGRGRRGYQRDED